MEKSLVLRTDADGVSTLTLNRPEKLNALAPAVFVALRRHLEQLAEDDEVGCVVLAGAGRAFCAGHDLGEIADGDTTATVDFESSTIDLLEQLPQPTIARIHGYCFTGGLELALACDLLVAAESAVLGDTHGQWGLAPVWGMSVRLPERVGIPTAKALMFTSRRVDGGQAQRLGLVDQAVPEGELAAAVSALAGDIVRNSWGTNRIDKQLLSYGRAHERRESLAHERSLPYGLPADMAERLAASRR
jgi:enoyl-CoA hydratase